MERKSKELTDSFREAHQKSIQFERNHSPFQLWLNLLYGLGAAAIIAVGMALHARKILEAAVQRSNQEGKKYITGEMNAHRNWQYYDSDCYFKSEAAISAITDGVNKPAQGPAYEGFAPPTTGKST